MDYDPNTDHRHKHCFVSAMINVLTMPRFNANIVFSPYNKIHLNYYPGKKLCVTASTKKGDNIPVFKDTFKSIVDKIRIYVLDPSGRNASVSSINYFVKMLDAL